MLEANSVIFLSLVTKIIGNRMNGYPYHFTIQNK